MRANAATRPAASLSTNAKIGIGVGAAAALALLYAVGSSSSSSSSSSAAGASSKGAGAGGGVGPPLGSKSGAQTTWTPTTSLVKGQTYRASGDAIDALKALGFTVYTEHDALPADWPSGDTATNRWRVDAVWTAPTTTLAQLLGKVPADLLVWQGTNSAALLGGGGGFTWTPTTTLTQGGRYRASLDARADLSALGFTIWDQYDKLPADWDASDTGPNRWRIEGPWLN